MTKGAKGEYNHNVKLTAEQVIEMRGLHKEGWDCAKLGRRFGISQRVAYKICNNESWKHLLDEVKAAPTYASAFARSVATRRIPDEKLELYKKCFELRKLGYLYDEIAEKLSINPKTAQIYTRVYKARTGYDG